MNWKSVSLFLVLLFSCRLVIATERLFDNTTWRVIPLKVVQSKVLTQLKAPLRWMCGYSDSTTKIQGKELLHRMVIGVVFGA